MAHDHVQFEMQVSARRLASVEVHINGVGEIALEAVRPLHPQSQRLPSQRASRGEHEHEPSVDARTLRQLVRESRRFGAKRLFTGDDTPRLDIQLVNDADLRR